MLVGRRFILIYIYISIYWYILIYTYLFSIGLDILVNNAGVAVHGDAFDEQVARFTLGTNYFGTVRACELLVPIVCFCIPCATLSFVWMSVMCACVWVFVVCLCVWASVSFFPFTYYCAKVRPGGRVVNVSSTAGLPSRLQPQLRARFLDPNLTKVCMLKCMRVCWCVCVFVQVHAGVLVCGCVSG